MLSSQIFTTKYVPLKTCFLYLSEKWTNILQNSPNGALRVTFGDHESYFSWGVNYSLDDHTVGINPTFAHTIGIKENEDISIELIKDVEVIQRIVVTPVSYDDWEILEINSDLVQNSLLNYLKIVFTDQKFVIWISKSMHLIVKIDSMMPGIQKIGRLQNFTEVEIIPIPKNTQLFPNEMPVKNNIWNNVLPKTNKLSQILNKYEPSLRLVSNVKLLSNIDSLSISDETKTILEQPFNVYLYQKHVPISTTFLQAQITKVLPNNIVEEELTMVVNIIVIDNFELLPKTLFPELEYSTVFINSYLQRLLRLENNMKVMLEYVGDGNVEEIHIQGSSSQVCSQNYEHAFKLYILEHSKHNSILLNSNCVIRISDLSYCYVRFVPGNCRFLLLNGDVIRDIKISVKSTLIDPENLRELAAGIFIKKSNRVMPKQCIYENDKFGELLNLGMKSLGNILITGQVGSGKTTLAKKLCQKSSYVKFIDCKSLKSKKVETVQKIFVQNLDDCLYYQPSVLYLDDLDIICGEPIETAEGILTTEANYFNRMSEMLHMLLTAYLPSNSISLFVTAQSKSKLNHHLYNSRGNHLFQTILETPILEKPDREKILKFILDEYYPTFHENELHEYSLQTEGYVFQDFIDLRNKCIFESVKRQGSSNEISKIDIENALSSMIPLSFHDIALHKPTGRKWNEVGGLTQAKDMLKETILWPIQYPEIFASCPIRLQTGILLYGHPGTGKTILAGAAAQHFGLRLISVKGPELLSKYIGASEESVRNIFEKAQSAKPCILFFDEFDSLAPRRGHDSTGVTDRVVNQLLTQLDGVEALNGVYVMAATSRPDLLDPALIRPGRLGRQVHCPLPNQGERLAILKALTTDLNLSNKVSLLDISKLTKGFTGADLQAVLYTAQLSAVEEVISTNENADSSLPETVEITQTHLLNSLKQTRPSLSVEEKLKYDKIYSAFQGKEEKSKGAVRKQKVTLA